MAPFLWPLKPGIAAILKIVLDLASDDQFELFQSLNVLFLRGDSPPNVNFALKI